MAIHCVSSSLTSPMRRLNSSRVIPPRSTISSFTRLKTWAARSPSDAAYFAPRSSACIQRPGVLTTLPGNPGMAGG